MQSSSVTSSNSSSSSSKRRLEAAALSSSSSSSNSPQSVNSRAKGTKDTTVDNCDNVLVLDSLQLISSSSGSCSPKPSSSSSSPSSGSKEMEIGGVGFYKTRICKHWRHGLCPLADKCKYAHGRGELRIPNSSMNTMELDDSSGLEFIIQSDPHLKSSPRYARTFLSNSQFPPYCTSTPPPAVVGSKTNYPYFSPQTTHTPYRNSPLGSRHTSTSVDLITSFNQTDRSFYPPAMISSLSCNSAMESSATPSSATASDADLSGNMIGAFCSSNAKSGSHLALGFTQAPLAANNTSNMRQIIPYLTPLARSDSPRYKSSPELRPIPPANTSSGSCFKNASSMLTQSQQSLAQEANITGGSASNPGVSTANRHPSEQAVSQNIHNAFPGELVSEQAVSQLMDSPTAVPLLKASEWCPLDDGIPVHLPSCSDDPPSREAVNQYIDNYLHIPSERKRLSVFEEICPSDDLSANCK